MVMLPRAIQLLELKSDRQLGNSFSDPGVPKRLSEGRRGANPIHQSDFTGNRGLLQA
jgi:hypothetical protein